MKVVFTETRIIKQIEDLHYVFELPEHIAVLPAEERDQWIYDNYDEMDREPEYAPGNIIDIQLEESEIEFFS